MEWKDFKALLVHKALVVFLVSLEKMEFKVQKVLKENKGSLEKPANQEVMESMVQLDRKVNKA